MKTLTAFKPFQSSDIRQFFGLIRKAYPANIEQAYSVSSYLNNRTLGETVRLLRNRPDLTDPIAFVWNEYTFWISRHFAFALQDNGTESVLWRLNEYTFVMEDYPVDQNTLQELLNFVEN